VQKGAVQYPVQEPEVAGTHSDSNTKPLSIPGSEADGKSTPSGINEHKKRTQASGGKRWIRIPMMLQSRQLS